MQLPVRSSFATADPEAARAHLVDVLGDDQLHLGVAGEGFDYRHDRLDVGSLVLDEVRTGLAATIGAPPTGRVFVVHVRAGHVHTVAGGVEGRARAGDVFLVGAHDAPLCSTYSADAVVAITSVDLPLLRQLDPQRATDRIARLDLPVLDRPTADAWIRTADHLRGALAGEGPGPLLLGAWTRLLGASVLEVFTPEGTGTHDADARPAPLRRAVAYIEAHPDVDLSPADLAEVAGVGVRALQLAFRKHLGTTPLAHLRRIRLDRVHADLLAADPDHQTVARIAAGWGFSDPSRFTALYKQTYGQLPSRTLHT